MLIIDPSLSLSNDNVLPPDEQIDKLPLFVIPVLVMVYVAGNADCLLLNTAKSSFDRYPC